MSLRPFGPKQADHPSVCQPCAICGRLFAVGDYTTLVATAPAGDDDAARMRMGLPYTAVAVEVCWSHAEAVAFFTGEEIGQ